MSGKRRLFAFSVFGLAAMGGGSCPRLGLRTCSDSGSARSDDHRVVGNVNAGEW